MKYLFFFSCLLIFNSSFAGNSVSCDFEEVYEDGSTQSGYDMSTKTHNSLQLFLIMIIF